MILLETRRLRLRRFTTADTDRLVELDSDEPEYVELGYRLRRAAWGRGYATEGGRALVAHGFTRADAERISARTLRDNVASQRVMERCGLRRAGEFVYVDDVIAGRSEQERAAVKYVLMRDDWQQQARGVR